MSQSIIPLQFEQYMQNKISVGSAPDMNEMIFAYLPGLDLTLPINRDQGLPDAATWVHQQDIDQAGKVGNNALAYSVVIPGTTSEFTFNAIYLHDKNTPDSCGMIVFKAAETKENGMASTKSLLQSYVGAAQIAGITVDAQTWQIDYQARLFGIEEDHRLSCLDNYGHTAFIHGFDVIQQADPDKYKITTGLVYIGGLRAVLTNEVIQTISTKPNAIYLDVVRTGTVLSKWENQLTVVISETELVDYVDDNNEQHYVAKLVEIGADGAVIDARIKAGLVDDVIEEKLIGVLSGAQGLPWNKDTIYKTGETCTREINGEVVLFEMYRGPSATCVDKDPADLANRQDAWTDETAPFYWTLAKTARPGAPLFPWFSMTFPEGTLNVLGNSVPVVVFWRIALAFPELVNAETGMIDFPETGGEFFRVLDQGRGVNSNRKYNTFEADELRSHAHNYYGLSSSTYDFDWDDNRYNIPNNSLKTTTATGGGETRPRNLAFPILVEI